MTNQISSVPTNNNTLKHMIITADFLGDRIRDARGDAYLPWMGSNAAEAESRRFLLRSYVYTIYRLNELKGTVHTFNGYPLEEWKVLPVFHDLIIPESVKMEKGSFEFMDLLDRSAFMITGLQEPGKPAAQLLDLDEFNAFTANVQSKCRLDASKITTFKACRINTTLGEVINRAYCHDRMANKGVYPLQLCYNFHSKDYLDFDVDNVRDKYIRAKVAETYSL